MRAIRALLTGCFGAAALALPSAATDWELNGTISQSFTASLNPGVDADDGVGGAYGTSARVGARLGASTQRTDWSLSSGISVSAFGGTEADDSLNRSSPSANGRVSYRGQRFTVSGNFNFSRASTTFLDLVPLPLEDPDEEPDFVEDIDRGEDELLVDQNAVRTRVGLGTGWSYSLSPVASLNVGLSGAVIRFSDDDDAFTPSSRVSGQISYSRQISPTSSVGLSTSAQRFTSDNEEQTEGLTVSASGTYSTSLTPTLSLGTSLGVSYSQIDEIIEDRTSVGFTGGVSANYRRTGVAAVSIFANQNVLPSSDTGSLRNVTTVGAGLSHALTRQTSFSLTARHAISSEIGGDESDLRQSFVLSPALSFQLSQSWRGSLRYTFRLIDDEDGTGMSNGLFLNISRGFTIIP